jgi:glyoxylase-like metal-dependent hydrolase (beta-lactamase superfamily II)
MTEVIQLKLTASNAYLVKGRKTILVDTGSPREGVKLLRGLAKLGIAPKEFALILHTHAHFDHAGSTLELKRWLVDVPIAVHEADAAMLASGRLEKPLTAITSEGKLMKPFLGGITFDPVKADIVIRKEISLKEFGVDGKIVFTPGHTAGSISIWLNDGQAILGDLMGGGSLGGNLFPGKPRYHYFADDLEQMRASIQKIMARKPKKLYVGHGGPLDAETVKAYFSKDIQF